MQDQENKLAQVAGVFKIARHSSWCKCFKNARYQMARKLLHKMNSNAREFTPCGANYVDSRLYVYRRRTRTMATPEWTFVEREVEIRIELDAGYI